MPAVPPRSPLRLAWGILWRAQAAHLAVVVAAPVLWSALVAAVGLVLLPFTLVGAGARTLALPAAIGHLAEPLCWIAAAPCGIAGRVLWSAPGDASAAEGFDLTLRWLWMAVLVAWVALFLWHRERAARAA